MNKLVSMLLPEVSNRNGNKSYICIQPPDENGEVVVLKVSGEESTGEFSGILHNKIVASGTP